MEFSQIRWYVYIQLINSSIEEREGDISLMATYVSCSVTEVVLYVNEQLTFNCLMKFSNQRMVCAFQPEMLQIEEEEITNDIRQLEEKKNELVFLYSMS